MRRSVEATAAILDKVIAGEIKATRAAERLGLGAKQVRRLAERYRREGIQGLQPRHRGRPLSGYSAEFEAHVIGLVRSKYEDFGPTLAAEKLAERDSIQVSREWLRKVMIKAGVWYDRVARQPRLHQPREPAERRGALVQIDGSHHRWFEDRGSKCVLLVFIDDATSEIGHLEFAKTENSMAYMSATRQYILKHGKPVAFYSDKHSIFRNPKANLDRSDGATQFSAVLDRLNIAIICADGPEAKGRVERANRTLQDRLVKELRLEGISTIEAANEFAQTFLQKHNLKFAKAPYDPVDAHRPLEPDESLDDEIRWEEPRKVSKMLTLQYNKVRFLLDDTPVSRRAVGQYVSVCDYPDGRIEVRHKGLSLPFRTFDKLRRIRQPDVADSKQLSAALEVAKALQEVAPHHRKRNGSAPSRRGQSSHIFPEYEISHKGKDIQADHSASAPSLPTRIVSPQLSLQYKNVRFVLIETAATRALIGREVGIFEDAQGQVEIRHQGVTLPYRALRKPAPAHGPGDRLAAALAFAHNPSSWEMKQPDQEHRLVGDASATVQAEDPTPPKTDAALVEAGLARMKSSEGQSGKLPGRCRGRRPKDYVGPPTVEQYINDIIARASGRKSERAA